MQANSNLEQLKITSFNCFFSQVCEISHGTNHINNDLLASKPNNCHLSYKKDQILLISQGGTKYTLPMDQNVVRVFPLIEGLLIQYIPKQDHKLSEILYLQRNKNSMDIEETNQNDQPKYSYATLTRHPLNPIKILGELRSDQITLWLRTNERVTCVSDEMPLFLTYSSVLRRNAFHMLLANTIEVSNQFQFAYIPTHTYSLKGLTQSPHSQVIAHTIFQQNHQTEEIVSFKLIKSSPLRPGTIILFGQTNREIRVYQINLYATAKSTKLLTIIKSGNKLQTIMLFPTPNVFIPQVFQKIRNDFQSDMIIQNANQLRDCAAISGQNSVTFYLGSEMVKMSSFLKSQGKLALEGSLVKDGFDSLLLKSLQVSIEQQSLYLNILRKYCGSSQNSRDLSAILYQFIPTNSRIMQIIHQLYQQLKFYQVMRSERHKVGQIMARWSLSTQNASYLDFYLREGYLMTNSSFKPIQNQISHQPFDLFNTIEKLFSNPANNTAKSVPLLFKRSEFMLNFFQFLTTGEIKISSQNMTRSLQLSQSRYHRQSFYRNQFPLLSQKAFHLQYFSGKYNEAVSTQKKLSSQLMKSTKKQEKAFFYLVQNIKSHQDLISYPLSIRAVFSWILREMRISLSSDLYGLIPKLGFDLIHRKDLFKNIKLYRKPEAPPPYHLKTPLFDENIKTLVHTSTSHQYFLTSNAAQMNKVNNDLAFEQVHRLLSSTSQIRIKVKDIQSIPQDQWEVQSQQILQKFANRKLAVLIGQSAFTLGTSRSFITDIIKIPKINLSGVMPNDIKITLDLKDDKENIIHWPEFHSGMAAGLKLSRHVIPLSEDHLKTWIFYQKPDTPRRDHSGFLLSLGLLGYLRCFSPTDIYQYLKPNNEFTSLAILLGVSASNIGRSDQALSKTLVLHIPVLLPPSIDVQIPINVQTSALIGIGLLHKGTCNRTMTQMTLSQIGKKPSTDKCLDRQGYSLAAGWALGMICLGAGDKKQAFRDLQLEQRLIRFIEGGKKMESPQSMISTNFVNQNKCSSIKEGPNVNLHITTPAALLAITLMYLKSNVKDIAQKITIPNSFNTIEECNPNHILLKTLSKNLIMWNSIQNTKNFILGQIPELIRFIFENTLSKVYEQYYLVYNVSEIDYQTISTIYVSVMTGAVMAMAFKYAGTGNRTAMETIKWHIDQLKTMKIVKSQFANDPLNKNSIDQYQLFSLLSTSIIALSIVMAGTCDIESLKIIRIIRKKFHDSKSFHYGFSMAVNMAIGFLFLGYGNYTFNQENMSIAALLIAVFPQYPNSPTDNKWHLQALRHFYVLSMQEKIFHAVDVDSNKVVNVSAEMDFLVDGKVVTQCMHTPVLLQESKKLLRIKVKDQDYFDLDFAFDPSKPDPKAIYIKKKQFQDINHSLLNPQNPLSTEVVRKNMNKSLCQENRYSSFVRIQGSKNRLSSLLPNSQKIVQISEKISKLEHQSNLLPSTYFELLKEDKLGMIEIYMTLKHQFENPITNEDGLVLNNTTFLQEFLKYIKDDQLFNSIIGGKIKQQEQLLLKSEFFKSFLLSPNQTQKNQNIESYKRLKLLRVPSVRNLKIIRQAIRKLKQKRQSFGSIEMLLYLAYPECHHNVLSGIIKIFADNS